MKLKILLILILGGQSLLLNAQDLNLAYASSKSDFLVQSLKHNNAHPSTRFSALEFNRSIKEGSTKHPLVKTGKILTFIGVPLIILGSVMVSNADALYYQCVNGDCEGDPQGGFGVLVLASGIGLSGTGIVLWTIGHNKSK